MTQSLCGGLETITRHNCVSYVAGASLMQITTMCTAFLGQFMAQTMSVKVDY